MILVLPGPLGFPIWRGIEAQSEDLQTYGAMKDLTNYQMLINH